MTEREINSCKHCTLCIGCGRGSDKVYGLQAVDTKEGCGNGMPEGKPVRKQYAPLVPACREVLMIAADIGTTTVVMQLRRITDGEVLDTFQAVNPQRMYGLDVMSRIQAAREEAVAKHMQTQIQEVLRRGIAYLAGETPVCGMVIAANTTMVHLLMGYETETLGKSPFVSRHLEEIHTTIEGLDTVILPGFSAFVGGDVLAGMYAYGVGRTKELTLFLDLGTNGEMALGNREKVVSTATAAGPAFEGRLEEGLWGADAIDILAKLYQKGLVDETGLLTEDYFESGVSVGGGVLTQEDIRSLQLAKAAVSGGIRVLAETYGITDFAQVHRVLLAGGFGYFLNPEAAIAVGMLPEALRGKCNAVGNAALEGAFCYGREWFSGKENEKGTSKELLRQGIAELKAKTEVYNLARAHKFEQYYIEAVNLPQREG